MTIYMAVVLARVCNLKSPNLCTECGEIKNDLTNYERTVLVSRHDEMAKPESANMPEYCVFELSMQGSRTCK